jgi:hypothetical protein
MGSGSSQRELTNLLIWCNSAACAGVDVVLPESLRLLLQPFGLSEEAEFDVVFEEKGQGTCGHWDHFVITPTRSRVLPSNSPEGCIYQYLRDVQGDTFKWILSDEGYKGEKREPINVNLCFVALEHSNPFF